MPNLGQSNRRRGAFAAALAIVASFSLTLPALSQAGSLRILAPASVEASQKVRFAAAPSQPTEAMTFYVDGKPRWTDSSPSWKFGRDGYVSLKPGRHVLKVKATQGNRVVTSEQTTYVEAAASEIQPAHTPKAPQPVAPAPAASPEAAPAPAPAPESPQLAKGLLFSGAKISDFGLQAAPGAITEVPDPAGSGETALKMTVEESDVYPVTPTENPRAQALSPAMIDKGEEFWLQTKFMLPKDFPSYVPGWMSLVSIYGPPFAGSSPWQIGINEGEFRWQRNGAHQDDIPWRSPIVKGSWTTVLLHERFDTNGFVEMWVNGERISFFPAGNRNPSHVPQTDHLEMETMDASNNGGANSAKIMQYRMAGMFQTASVYFGGLKVGATRAAVES